MPFTSPPAQKAPPAPVSTSAPTSEATSASAIAAISPSIIGVDIALRRSGRFSVMVITPSAISTPMSSVPVSKTRSVMTLPCWSWPEVSRTRARRAELPSGPRRPEHLLL